MSDPEMSFIGASLAHGAQLAEQEYLAYKPTKSPEHDPPNTSRHHFYVPRIALTRVVPGCVPHWTVSRRMSSYPHYAEACIYAHKRNVEEGRL